MSKYRFELGAKLLLNKRVYEITAVQKNKTFQLTDLKTAINSYFKESELHTELNKGQLEFLDDNEIDLTALTETSALVDFQSYPKHIREKALRKLAYVKEAIKFVDISLTKKEKIQLINHVAEKIQDYTPPKSWTTITRWLEHYINSDENVQSLIDENYKKGNRTPRFLSDVEELVQKAINFYLTKKRPTIKNAYKELRKYAWGKDITHYPCYDSFRKRIDALDKYLVFERRYNSRTAEVRFRFYGSGSRPTRPLELTEIDHTPLPFIAVDDETRLPIGRPTLTTLIDKYSRMVLGFYLGFSPPSILNVIECLRHAILPKTEIKNLYPNIQLDWPARGIPEAILVDNGKEFLSNDFNEICAVLGIQKPRSPPRHPWYKGSVERHFRTIADGLLDDKAGKTFSNIIEKKDYDPKKDAFISFSSLVEIVHQWIIDIHNNSVNRSINTTPYALWNSSIDWYPPRMPKNIQILNVTLGKTESRTIQHYGIDFKALRYNSKELSLLQRKLKKGTYVKLKFNPNEIGKIFVLDPTNNNYLVVPCTDFQYANHKTLFQHELIRKYAREVLNSVDIDALMHAEKNIQEIVDKERLITQKVRRASKQARYKNLSQDVQNKLKLSEQTETSFHSLSNFGDDSFDPYVQKPAIPAIAPEMNDDDLDDLYADSDDWSSNYSLTEDNDKNE